MYRDPTGGSYLRDGSERIAKEIAKLKNQQMITLMDLKKAKKTYDELQSEYRVLSMKIDSERAMLGSLSEKMKKSQKDVEEYTAFLKVVNRKLLNLR